MKFLPFDRMVQIVEKEQNVSDTDYFNSLMYLGEMVTKFAVLGMVAAVSEGRERNQYRLRHRLVRSDGIGEWSQVLDEILNRVPAHYLISVSTGMGNEVYQLTERTRASAWQHDSVAKLHDCLCVVCADVDRLGKRVQGKRWFGLFATLRNKTRGHGAPTSEQLSRMCMNLGDSIQLFVENFRLFARPWAYVSQSMSGKYRVVKMTEAAHTLDRLKTIEGRRYQLSQGVYILFAESFEETSIRSVDLVSTDIESLDFFMPNGGWNNKRYKALSYISNTEKAIDGKDYQTLASDLPPSDTRSLKAAVIEDSIYTMPSRQAGYIGRHDPEERLLRELVEDNQHRIVTLVGGGGIGKTWLTLEVLYRVLDEGAYDAILWFSARDIDLLSDGAKPVKPDVLNEADIAAEFFRHMGPIFYDAEYLATEVPDKIKFLRDNINKSELGQILFVFDNFETVSSPIELYNWIETHLRLPNKALITTRFRDFRGDFPVELRGMNDAESKALIDATARELGITGLLRPDYTRELINTSAGHPYVMKILLADVRKSGRTGRVERIIGSKDEMLENLFERTYDRLSPAAKRVFLTLCKWRSLVAETQLKAVLLRPLNEEMDDISSAIDELFKSSLIERNSSGEDTEVFWSVNQVTRKFGLRKLETDASKMAIEADIKFLQLFGVTQKTDLTHGMRSRIRRFISEVETKVLRDRVSVAEYAPIVDEVAKVYHEAWPQLADVYEKRNEDDGLEKTLRRYLELSNDIQGKMSIWERLADFYQIRSRYSEELLARIQLAQLPKTSYDKISDAVNRFNNINKLRKSRFDEVEKEEIIDLLIELMENRVEEAGADDCSRLGWLYMNSRQPEKALESAQRGLRIGPSHRHCLNLKSKALDAIGNRPS